MNAVTITNPASPLNKGYAPDATSYRAPGFGVEGFAYWLEQNDPHALSVWSEAHWFDMLHDAHKLNDAYPWAPVTVAPVELSAHERDVQAAQRQAEALGASFAQREKLRAIVTERRDAQRALADAQTTIAQLSERVEQLRFEQIEYGDDPRLNTFWEKAAQRASEENYCGEYDRMAELLGGPGRIKTYAVTTHVTVEITVNVEATTEDDAIEQVDDWDHNDMERHIAELSYYNINVQEINARYANAES